MKPLFEVYDNDPTSEVEIPIRGTTGSCGYDLKAHLTEDIHIGIGQIKLIKTGIKANIPNGYCGLVCSRSGLALKGIQVYNAPGIIDIDYHGEIGVILANMNNSNFIVSNGDRIAQMVFVPCHLDEGKVLTNTARESSGYGSTGV